MKRLKQIDISHKMSDYRDHSQVEKLSDRIQEFKSRFQIIKKNLAESKEKIKIAEDDPEVKFIK